MSDHGLTLPNSGASGEQNKFRYRREARSKSENTSPIEYGAILNDASELSATPIKTHTRSSARGDALVEFFRSELASARAEGRPVNVGAARHSMGGQAIPRNGTAITVEGSWIELDRTNGTYRVSGGARWADVISALDGHGFSPAVMQSNNDFGVAATFSVNAHGWPVPFGPMGSTVRSFRMVLPDGELITASREENADLFSLSMGGYGLIGLIVDLEIDVVANQRLAPGFTVLPADEFPEAFLAAVHDPNKPMVYARMNVDCARMFDEALLVSYSPVKDQSDLPPALGSGTVSPLASLIYRGQVGRESVKRLRWQLERGLGPMIARNCTRNTLLNGPVATLRERNPKRVDLLHEYFLPAPAFGEFVKACRDTIPSAAVELLNITLRYVDGDPVSVLAHSPSPRIAAVMSFNQQKNANGETDHVHMTQALIDKVLELGGSYYLPYRPHARLDQFALAYPRAGEFAAAKQAIDPHLILRNNLWDQYLRKF